MKQPRHGRSRKKGEGYYPDGKDFQTDDPNFNELVVMDTQGPRTTTKHNKRKYVTIVKDMYMTWREQLCTCDKIKLLEKALELWIKKNR